MGHELGRACAPGTEALLSGTPIELGANETHLLEFELDRGDRCVRVLAVARALAAGGECDPALAVRDGKGRMYGEDTLRGPIALVNRGGPVCIAEPGRYQIVVSTGDTACRLLVEVRAPN